MSISSGCKLFGAYRTFISIKDAAVLIHSTVGCNWGTSTFHVPSRLKEVRQASSVVYEEDIIYGGEDSLERALGLMDELYESPVIFVLTGCVTEIMEDDVQKVIDCCKLSKPVFLLKAAGFKGNMVSGITDALLKLIDIMTLKKTEKNSINIIGIFSDDYRSDADIKSIKRLIGSDIRINSIIPYGGYSEILNAPAAALNVVFEGFEKAGEYMERKFGIPYIIVNYPYGIAGSKNFALKIMEYFGINDISKHDEMKDKALKSLEMACEYLHKLNGIPTTVVGDCVRANSIRNFLEDEIGMQVEVFCNSSSGEDMENFKGNIENSDSVIIFGSSYERGIADSLKIPLIRYTYPVFDSICIGDRSYAGFDGAVNLIEDMVNSTMTIDYRRSGMYGK